MELKQKDSNRHRIKKEGVNKEANTKDQTSPSPRKTHPRSENETKNWRFENNSKTSKRLARLIKKKRNHKYTLETRT